MGQHTVSPGIAFRVLLPQPCKVAEIGIQNGTVCAVVKAQRRQDLIVEKIVRIFVRMTAAAAEVQCVPILCTAAKIHPHGVVELEPFGNSAPRCTDPLFYHIAKTEFFLAVCSQCCFDHFLIFLICVGFHIQPDCSLEHGLRQDDLGLPQIPAETIDICDPDIIGPVFDFFCVTGRTFHRSKGFHRTFEIHGVEHALAKGQTNLEAGTDCAVFLPGSCCKRLADQPCGPGRDKALAVERSLYGSSFFCRMGFQCQQVILTLAFFRFCNILPVVREIRQPLECFGLFVFCVLACVFSLFQRDIFLPVKLPYDGIGQNDNSLLVQKDFFRIPAGCRSRPAGQSIDAVCVGERQPCISVVFAEQQPALFGPAGAAAVESQRAGFHGFVVKLFCNKQQAALPRHRCTAEEELVILSRSVFFLQSKAFFKESFQRFFLQSAAVVPGGPAEFLLESFAGFFRCFFELCLEHFHGLSGFRRPARGLFRLVQPVQMAAHRDQQVEQCRFIRHVRFRNLKDLIHSDGVPPPGRDMDILFGESHLGDLPFFVSFQFCELFQRNFVTAIGRHRLGCSVLRRGGCCITHKKKLLPHKGSLNHALIFSSILHFSMYFYTFPPRLRPL